MCFWENPVWNLQTGINAASGFAKSCYPAFYDENFFRSAGATWDYTLRWDATLYSPTHKWASKMRSGSRSFLIHQFPFWRQFSDCSPCWEIWIFPLFCSKFLLLKKKSIHLKLGVRSTYNLCATVLADAGGRGLLWSRLSAQGGLIDRRLLVENMEIRQAEGKSRPPGEFEKNLKLHKFFKMSRWPWMSFVFLELHQYASVPLGILGKTLWWRSAGVKERVLILLVPNKFVFHPKTLWW